MSDHYPDGTPLPKGVRYHAFPEIPEVPLMEISTAPLNVAFDVVNYLQDHTEEEMWELLGKLKDFCK